MIIDPKNINNMFSYISQHKTYLTSLLKELEECNEKREKINELSKVKMNKILSDGEYITAPENMDLIDQNKGPRVVEHTDTYLLSDCDFEIVCKKLYEEIKNNELMEEFVQKYKSDEPHFLDYGLICRERKIQIEDELISTFEEFTGFDESKLKNFKHHEKYVKWIIKTIKTQ